MGIRTHDSGVRMGEETVHPRLRQRGHCDRLKKGNINFKNLFLYVISLEIISFRD
jgi:hypothetical protein